MSCGVTIPGGAPNSTVKADNWLGYITVRRVSTALGGRWEREGLEEREGGLEEGKEGEESLEDQKEGWELRREEGEGGSKEG